MGKVGKVLGNILIKILIVCSIVIVILLSVGDFLIYKNSKNLSSYRKLDSLGKVDTILKYQMYKIKDSNRGAYDCKDSISSKSYIRYNQINGKLLKISHQIDSIKNKL